MSIEAMKQALEALKYHMEQTRPINMTQNAIATLSQAIEQAEKQEPVAWMYKGNFHDFDPSEWASPEFVVTPLFTAPPKREWVGLTDDEIHKIVDACTPDEAEQEELNDFARAVRFAEAKLKEKNGGS